jgi:hypothetical protein
MTSTFDLACYRDRLLTRLAHGDSQARELIAVLDRAILEGRHA